MLTYDEAVSILTKRNYATFTARYAEIVAALDNAKVEYLEKVRQDIAAMPPMDRMLMSARRDEIPDSPDPWEF